MNKTVEEVAVLIYNGVCNSAGGPYQEGYEPMTEDGIIAILHAQRSAARAEVLREVGPVVRAAVEFMDALGLYQSYIVSPRPEKVSIRLSEAKDVLYEALETLPQAIKDELEEISQ